MIMNLQSTQLPLPPFPPKPKFLHVKPRPSFKVCCSLSTVSAPQTTTNHKPFPAEVSRTIMELSSIGTLSTLAQDGWPLGVGVRFAVDDEGTPVLRLPQPSLDSRSTLHVQLEQCGLRSPQCTIQGSLNKPADATILRERDFAEEFVTEINTNYGEDVHRFCNVYVDLDFQVSEAKMIRVDRLGFDSPQNGVFDVRIPFRREVTDEKGAKSSFNGMSQLACEVEKNFQSPDFKKVKQLKKITYSGVL